MGITLAVFKQDGKMPSSKDWLVSFASTGERTSTIHLQAKEEIDLILEG